MEGGETEAADRGLSVLDPGLSLSQMVESGTRKILSGLVSFAAYKGCYAMKLIKFVGSEMKLIKFVGFALYSTPERVFCTWHAYQ